MSRPPPHPRSRPGRGLYITHNVNMLLLAKLSIANGCHLVILASIPVLMDIIQSGISLFPARAEVPGSAKRSGGRTPCRDQLRTPGDLRDDRN
jgi:hypothetical protein